MKTKRMKNHDANVLRSNAHAAAATANLRARRAEAVIVGFRERLDSRLENSDSNTKPVLLSVGADLKDLIEKEGFVASKNVVKAFS